MDEMMKRVKKESGVDYHTKQPYDLWIREARRLTYQLMIAGNTATFATIDGASGRLTSTTAILKSSGPEVRLFQNLKKDEFMKIDIEGKYWEDAALRYRG